MLKNVAGQYIDIEAWSSATGAEVTGDAGNITAYIEKDAGGAVQSDDVNPSEVDATNMPGVYRFTLTQAETNCNNFTLKAKSTTANVRIGLIQEQPMPLPNALPDAAGGLPISDAGGLDLDAIGTGAARALAALPNAAADAAGGLPISDAGGLDLDAKLANTNEVTAARMGALTDWINGGRLDLLLDATKAVTDLLSASAGTIVGGTVDNSAFAPTTTAFEADDITEATANHYKGRIILFTSGALANQATSITAYELSGANGKFTVLALTEAPANDVTFIIV